MRTTEECLAVRVYTARKSSRIVTLVVLSIMFTFGTGCVLQLARDIHQDGFSAQKLFYGVLGLSIWALFGLTAVSMWMTVINCRIELRSAELYFRDWRKRESHVPWDEIRSIHKIDVMGRYGTSPYRLDIESESSTGGRSQSRIDIGFLDDSAIRQLLDVLADKAGARQVGKPTSKLLSIKIVTQYECADGDRKIPQTIPDS